MPRISTMTNAASRLFVFLLLASFATIAFAHHDNEADHVTTTGLSVTATATATTAGAPDLPPTTMSKPAKVVPKKVELETTEIVTVYLPSNADVLPKAGDGDKIDVHYTGKLLANGNKFDSSVDRGRPFSFTLGIGQVIEGWDKGIKGMVVGEKRKLTIPSTQAYKERGFGDLIPANSALVFDVELLSLKKKNHGEL